MKRATGLAAGGLALVLLACAPSGEAPATVGTRPAPVPARFGLPLPARSSQFEAWFEARDDLPPMAHVVDALAAGDAAMLVRLREAGANVAADDVLPWARQWDRLLEWTEVQPAFCDAVRADIQGPATPARMALVGSFARRCRTGDAFDLVIREDTPPWAVLAWYDETSGYADATRPQPSTPRLRQAVQAIFENGDGVEARSAAFVLASLPEPEARAALRELHAGIDDVELADQVAMAFDGSDDAGDRARLAAACGRNPQDPVCSPDPRPEPDGASPVAPNRSTAATRELATALVDAGFTRVARLAEAELAANDHASALLVAAGHAVWFDVETDQYPNQHDRLMRSFARLVAPDLDGALFEEAAPALDDESSPYTLRAYLDGQVHELDARNLGDWYDTDAVLQLMNHLLQVRASRQRLLPLAASDQALTVVGGPRSALDTALQRGWLQAGDADLARRLGRDAERAVLEKLGD